MARKKYGFNEARIARFYKEGRGAGEGSSYKPWLTTSDVPSNGRTHRIYWPATKRVHHLLSDNEYYAFLHLRWDDAVVDIREQFPLDRRETLKIAADCNVRHPIDPATGALSVMTTDMLVTTRRSTRPQIAAYAIKGLNDLRTDIPETRRRNLRTLEKLEIERRYWERRSVPWTLLLDVMVKTQTGRNLDWILGGAEPATCDEHLGRIDDLVWPLLKTELSADGNTPIRLLCIRLDDRLGFRHGGTLAAFRRFLATKAITADLSKAALQDLPASQFEISEDGR